MKRIFSLLAASAALALCSCQTTGSSCCSTPGSACCKKGDATKSAACATCATSGAKPKQ